MAFREGRVAAVFTLGMKRGWRSDDGLKVGGLMSTKQMHDGQRVEDVRRLQRQAARASDDAVTSVLTQGPIIYGFALTRPSEPVCH